MTIKQVWDKSDCILDIGSLRIQAAPKAHPPFTCQAIAEEQDTYLIMGEQKELKDPGKPVWYLTNKMESADAYPLGSVVIKGSAPLRLCAVIHDIEQDPTCNCDSVLKAYNAIIKISKERNITSMALPILGTVHGKLSIEESMQQFRYSIMQGYPENLEKLWIILPSESNCNCLEQLR